MKRTHYENGFWSERNENELKYGKGKISKSKTFCSNSKIVELSSTTQNFLRVKGVDPSKFIGIQGGNLLGDWIAKIFIGEVEECIKAAKKMAKIKEEAKAEALKKEIKAGKVYRVAVDTLQDGASLSYCRDTENGIIKVGNDEKINREAIFDVIGTERRADGELHGCDNLVWKITDKEYEQIIAKNAELNSTEPKTTKGAEIKNKIEDGYCTKCQSYCFGDCDNKYAKNPFEAAAGLAKREVKLSETADANPLDEA